MFEPELTGSNKAVCLYKQLYSLWVHGDLMYKEMVHNSIGFNCPLTSLIEADEDSIC